MANSKAVVALAIGLIFLLNLAGQCYGYIVNGGLQYGFYNGKCRSSDVEEIVRKAVYNKFLSDRTIAPALIRMQFHDCFVNGCDASILLDGPNSEKTAPPNLSVRGFDVIDAAKDAVEKVCAGVVSCADIIIMATRDVVSLSGGGRYSVQTGRRDGFVSLAQNTRTLPPPSASVSSAVQAFAKKGLTVSDMIYLLGGHSIGIAHCSLFKDRLYNFKNTGKPDPTMDLFLLSSLRRTCSQNATVDRTANLDQNPSSSSVVDKSYYSQIMMRRGVLKFDQDLASDPLSKFTVAAIASSWDFNTKFGKAMVKMGAIQVLTGTQGQIRKSCRAINRQISWTSLIKS
uniref:peroxidase 60-like n=1 Tax=Erigeron canadensis TaxID=72917 RepID=UPI001CB8E1FE|nr:peroxidase 60-like [Erigeron canadensis]